MHVEQRQRATTFLNEKGIHAALFGRRETILWLTGFAAPVLVGPNPFAGGPPLLWFEDGHFTLIVMDGWAGAAQSFGEQANCEVVTYPGYTIERPVDGPSRLGEVWRPFVAGRMGKHKTIGLETAAVPAALASNLNEAELVAVDGWLDPLREIKTAEELGKLRDNFRLTDIGHAAARQAVQVGQREIDVWAAAEAAMVQAAGQRISIGNDCVVSYRQDNIGGWPLDLEIRPQDSVIVDLSTLLHGYWSDSCATYYASEPTAQQKAMHHTAAEALEFGASLLKPGAVASEIDRQLRQFIADAGYPVYPHHTGHGVGASGHEGPRIVPYNDQPLAAGMVIMLEPGIYYAGEAAVRLEDAFLITADGAERLTQHDKSLPL